MTSVKESQAHDLLEVVRGNDVDRKIAEFATIKAQVKHQAVNSDAINPLFEACRFAIASPNISLSAQALSCLGHLTRRVSIQEPGRIRSQANHVLPLLVEKLGDAKERNKSVALNAILEIYKHASPEVEKAMKDWGFTSKSPRTRQESIKWLAHIHTTYPGFSFKAYTPFLMNMLEDSSELVRDCARDVVVELFSNSADHAKSDLKRELQKRQVRKGISNFIISQLGIPAGAADSSVPALDPHEGEAPSGKQTSKSVSGTTSGNVASSTYLSSLPGHEMEELNPIYVNTNRELEDIFDDMVEPFEGRESEHNWTIRGKNIEKIRGLLRGNAYQDFQVTFLAKIKSLLDGILKTVNSLRTTVSTSGGQLVKDLTIVAGPGIDPMVEILLMNLVKMSAVTKKLTSQLGNVIAATIFAHVSYHAKLLQHVWNACNDKNVQPRSYAAGWITVLLETHIDHKAHIEHTGGVDILIKCIKRGLADANPGVRENMRITYWKFGVIWPEQAHLIIEGLDNSSRKLLEKTNPNIATQGKGAASARAPALVRSTTAPARPSVREAILAQKRSKANLKSQYDSADAPGRQTASPPPGPTGLASAPVRRPNLKARPAPEKLHIDSANGGGYGRPTSPTVSTTSRATPLHASKRNGSRSPPLSPPLARMARGVTPMRAQSPLVTSRKLTVLEQLNSPDWKVRVEGIVVVACILAKRTPPNYDGHKMPTLPPSDVFAPTLAKLLNDPQPEVVEHVVAPEVLAELAKVVPIEQIVPKVLLLSEGDDEQHALPINTSTMPALKKLMSDADFADLLFKVIQSMSSSGVFTRKLSPGSFTPTQKRKITHGCLLWMDELADRHSNGVPNGFFSDPSNYKLVLNRFIQMMSTMKPPNTVALAALLKNLRRLDRETFNKTLATFETSIARELRKAWGVGVEDDVESIIVEEKVADVEQVLGSVPQIGGTARSHEDFAVSNIPPAPRPVTPPPQSVQDHENLKTLPPLPATPEQVLDLASSTSGKKSRQQDENPIIKVYQDPVIENGTGAFPEKVALSTGKEWQSYKQGKQVATLPKTPGDSARLLQTLIGRLQTRDMDTQAFRKLIGIARENPVREPLQEANGEDLHDIWQGGPVFRELLTALLEYLNAEDIESSRATDLRVQGLLVLKQLLSKAAPYFARHEGEILLTLISIRGKYPSQSQITTGIEEISDEYLQIADPKAGIDAIVDMNLPADNPSFRPATQSWCMSLSCLADLVKISRTSSLEPQLARLGRLAVKSLDDEDSEVRRSCVTMCIELHSKINDDERLFDDILKGMKSGHQNLLAYYFAKREGETRQ